MKQLLVLSLGLHMAVVGWLLTDRSPVAEGGEPLPPPILNGDVNCDGVRDLSDAVSLLGWIFCSEDAPCDATDPTLSGQLASCQADLAISQTRLARAHADYVSCETERSTVTRRGVTLLAEEGPREQGVTGTVEELDTGKIVIMNFSYQGGGIIVQVWLYDGGNPMGGFAIGPDLVGRQWVDEPLIVDIPAHITPDMYDYVSIWCVAANADFGHCALGPASP